MVTLFVGNFEFEHRLSGQGDQPLSEPVRRLTEELACVWLAVADDGDLLWTPAGVDAEFFQTAGEAGLPSVRPVSKVSEVAAEADVCPWGFTDAVLEWAHSHGWNCHTPDEAVVRQVNSRLFSARLEREWGVGLRDSAVIRSLDDLL